MGRFGKTGFHRLSSAHTAFLHDGHLEIHDLAFHGAAGNKVHDQKNGQGDADEGGNDQKKTTDEITGHGAS